jgi:hypothetical protein
MPAAVKPPRKLCWFDSSPAHHIEPLFEEPPFASNITVLIGNRVIELAGVH